MASFRERRRERRREMCQSAWARCTVSTGRTLDTTRATPQPWPRRTTRDRVCLCNKRSTRLRLERNTDEMEIAEDERARGPWSNQPRKCVVVSRASACIFQARCGLPKNFIFSPRALIKLVHSTTTFASLAPGAAQSQGSRSVRGRERRAEAGRVVVPSAPLPPCRS